MKAIWLTDDSGSRCIMIPAKLNELKAHLSQEFLFRGAMKIGVEFWRNKSVYLCRFFSPQFRIDGLPQKCL